MYAKKIYKFASMESTKCLKNLAVILTLILLMFVSDNSIISGINVYFIFILVLASIFWIIHRIFRSETEV